MNYTLRPYQKEAVAKMFESLDFKHSKDIVSLPTGAGKSLVIADFVSELNLPTIILQPSREILAQNRDKLATYVDKEDIGVYSASFNSKEIKKFTFATIQSVFKKAYLFQNFPIVIIDEVHLFTKEGMFDKFLSSLKDVKVYGLTATPFRNVTEEDTDFRNREIEIKTYLKMLTQVGFNNIIYSISTKELQDAGYLCQLEYMTKHAYHTDFRAKNETQLRNSFERNFIGEMELQLTFNFNQKLEPVLYGFPDYKSIIIFCTSIRIAELLSLKVSNVKTACLSGKTPKKERKQIIDDFKSGKIKAIFNVGVLTTGFDHPELDLIVLARPTKSLIFYNQMLGRGLRNAPGKEKCTIIDLTGTVSRLGKLRDIKVGRDANFEWNVFTKQYPDGMRDERISYYLHPY